jgi:hypothetical protein
MLKVSSSSFKRRSRKEAKDQVGFLNSLLAFFKDPLPFKGKKLDDRFKYQYAYDRYRTDASSTSGTGFKKERCYESATAKDLSDIPSDLSSLEASILASEELRESIFADAKLMALNRVCTEEEMILFFRLDQNFTNIDLKSAYRDFVKANHPDYCASSESLDPVGYALAQKKVQLANQFKELLEKAV